MFLLGVFCAIFAILIAHIYMQYKKSGKSLASFLASYVTLSTSNTKDVPHFVTSNVPAPGPTPAPAPGPTPAPAQGPTQAPNQQPTTSTVPTPQTIATTTKPTTILDDQIYGDEKSVPDVPPSIVWFFNRHKA